MAAIVDFIGQRLTDADSNTNWSITKIDGGGGTWGLNTNNTDSQKQGAGCVEAQSANTTDKRHIIAYDYNTAAGSPLNLITTYAGQNIYVWAQHLLKPTTTGSYNTLPGLAIALSTTSVTEANTAVYTFYGAENYPGGWVRMVVDPRKPPTVSGAGYDPTSVSFVGILVTSSTAKAVPGARVDAIDIGSGLIVHGSGTSEDGFGDMLFTDEGTLNNQYGVLTSLEDTETVLQVNGKLLIGDNTGTNETVFNDINKIITFANPKYFNSAGELVNAIEDDYPSISFVGNTTSGTFVTLGAQVGAGDNTRGRNGVTFLGNDDYFINMDFNDGNVNSLYLYGCTVRNFDDPSGTVDAGVTWTATGSHGFFGSVWDKCRELNPDSGVTIRNSTFLNHNYQGVGERGSILWNSTTPPDDQIIDIKNCSFIANDNAIYHSESGTYIYDNLSFSDNTFDIYFDGSVAGQDLIINATNGTLTTLSATTGNAGDTVTVTATVTLTITGFVDNSELYARDATDATIGIVERFNEESAVGNYQYVYNDPGSDIDLFIMKNQTSPTDTGYQWLSIRDFTLPSDAQTLQVFQIIERNSNIF